MREQAALSLGSFRDDAKTAIQPLIKSLKDDYVDVRAAAAHGLAEMGPVAIAALDDVRAAMKDENAYVRITATRAVRELTE